LNQGQGDVSGFNGGSTVALFNRTGAIESFYGGYFARTVIAKGNVVAVSGFGNVAWGAITKANQLGAKVVTISGPVQWGIVIISHSRIQNNLRFWNYKSPM